MTKFQIFKAHESTVMQWTSRFLCTSALSVWHTEPTARTDLSESSRSCWGVDPKHPSRGGLKGLKGFKGLKGGAKRGGQRGGKGAEGESP